MTKGFIDYFEVLGVTPDDDGETVSRAFRLKAKELHPDMHHDNDHEKFARLQNAYDTLKDKTERKRYTINRARHYGALSIVEFKPAVRDLFDDMVEYFKGIGGLRKKDAFELVLDREYETYDRICPLDVPLVTECPDCKGIGSTTFFECKRCAGKGSFTNHREVEIEIPRDTPDGSIIRREVPGQVVVVRLTYR